MYAWFKKPYYRNPAPVAALKQAALFGLFVFLFLFIFKPFGILGMSGSFLGIILGFAAMTLAVMIVLNVLIPLFFPAFFEETGWTVGKEVLYAGVNLWGIGVANFLFFAYTAKSDFSPGAFWGFQLFTVSIGVFPVGFLTLARERQSRAAYERTATILTEELPKAAVSSDRTVLFQLRNGLEPLTLLTSELRYLQAADNYVYVHFFRHGPQRRIIRSTLKLLEEDLNTGSGFLRCHKSYIVNLDHVVRISGNAQGYKLHLRGCDEPIPVSRQHNATIKARLATGP
jgi:DNA-binding LytR/AlgR family response regulator